MPESAVWINRNNLSFHKNATKLHDTNLFFSTNSKREISVNRTTIKISVNHTTIEVSVNHTDIRNHRCVFIPFKRHHIFFSKILYLIFKSMYLIFIEMKKCWLSIIVLLLKAFNFIIVFFLVKQISPFWENRLWQMITSNNH